MGNILDLLGRLSSKKKDTRVLLLGLDDAGTSLTYCAGIVSKIHTKNFVKCVVNSVFATNFA